MQRFGASLGKTVALKQLLAREDNCLRTGRAAADHLICAIRKALIPSDANSAQSLKMREVGVKCGEALALGKRQLGEPFMFFQPIRGRK